LILWNRELFLAIIAGELNRKGAPAFVSVVKVWSVILQRFCIVDELYGN
jgi:hypothetical protein